MQENKNLTITVYHRNRNITIEEYGKIVDAMEDIVKMINDSREGGLEMKVG